MKQTGTHINKKTLENLGMGPAKQINWNWVVPALYEQAIKDHEGDVALGGPLVVTTGAHTGRAAKDKFTVRDATTENTVWWDENAAMTPAHFAALWADFKTYMAQKELYIQEVFGGADPDYRLPVNIITELAWHSLFARHMLRLPSAEDLSVFDGQFTVISMPGFRADPKRHGTRSETVIAVNISERLVLIGGTAYAGEIKKSVFTILNYLLPERRVMPMHCSVNTAKDDTNDAAVFFGLSGTGKTTLSADPNRTLIGDDEHGWSENGLFNFEGGCYAKMIRLSARAEPEIYATTHMWATLLENVVMNPVSRTLDLDDDSLAENSRGAYPLTAIPNASRTGRCGQPRNIIMLTADAFGVLPPIARMSPSQAMYHFLSGYTAKVAGTEQGITEPQATFSTCFGAPFMPRHPSEYGNLLRDLIDEHHVACWLVNTGWTGGPYGIGERMPIKATRALLSAALDGSLNQAQFRKDENFGVDVPVAVVGVDSAILDPRSTWADKAAYDAQAAKLRAMFIENFVKYEGHVDADVRNAGPKRG